MIRSVGFGYSLDADVDRDVLVPTGAGARRLRPSCARTLIVSRSTSIVAVGSARRLKYQAGFVGAPPLEAVTTNRSPSRE